MAFKVVWPQATLDQLHEIREYIAAENLALTSSERRIKRSRQIYRQPLMG